MAGKTRRIYEVAKHYKISSNAMMKLLRELNFTPKSHMSVATPEMIAAVNLKFAREREEAKKAMVEKKRQRTPSSQQPSASNSGTGAVKAAPTAGQVPAMPPRPGGPGRGGGPQRRKRKDRRRKRDQRSVDHTEVQRAFRATMADLSGAPRTHKRRRSSDSGATQDDGAAPVIKVNEYMTVAELANIMDRRAAEVVAKLMEMGMMATINQRLDMDTIEMVAAEFGYDVEPIAEIGESVVEEENEEAQVTRAPVVTVMGHVDHGKTSLLDYIRKTNVVGGEAGSITQHMGAYEVQHGEERIVFLDTPGHEAFTAMRARGAQITDIAVIIVAADEGVMPQTIEAIDHARAAGVPIIVAISKIDKPNARPDEVKTQLSNHNLLPEEWGGKTITVEISSKTGEGIDKLLDMIVLQAQIMDLKADPTIKGQGVVVDSRLERGRGPVATVLIQKGKSKIGDIVVAGIYSGRIRTMVNDRGQKLKEVGPATPVQITGLSGVPQAGDSFLVVHDEQEAREITVRRSQIKREYEFRHPSGPVTLERFFDQIQEGQVKELRLIIKGDVDGSVEVLSDTLGRIQTSEVKTNIIRRGVGAITESDILLAAASEAIVIGFQVTLDARAREAARREKVDVRLYSVIYEAEEDVRKALEGLLAPTVNEQFVGMAEVRQVFKVPKIGAVAGCYVKSGRIHRNDKVKLMREGKLIYTGTIASLKRFKDDAREVREGFECGIGIEGFNDI
ncbi:MAG: translation initiation factor IF-2, partial [Candidatus Zixiibacteriota bacterium]